MFRVSGTDDEVSPTLAEFLRVHRKHLRAMFDFVAASGEDQLHVEASDIFQSKAHHAKVNLKEFIIFAKSRKIMFDGVHQYPTNDHGLLLVHGLNAIQISTLFNDINRRYGDDHDEQLDQLTFGEFERILQRIALLTLVKADKFSGKSLNSDDKVQVLYRRLGVLTDEEYVAKAREARMTKAHATSKKTETSQSQNWSPRSINRLPIIPNINICHCQSFLGHTVPVRIYGPTPPAEHTLRSFRQAPPQSSQILKRCMINTVAAATTPVGLSTPSSSIRRPPSRFNLNFGEHQLRLPFKSSNGTTVGRFVEPDAVPSYRRTVVKIRRKIEGSAKKREMDTIMNIFESFEMSKTMKKTQ